MKRSKLYRTKAEVFDREKFYTVVEAVDLLKKMPLVKFDETVELSFRLGIDPRQSDQIVRGATVLPQGTGKTQRVIVIADGEPAEQAKAAGATEVGNEELLQRIKGGWLDFDIMIATPAAMKEVRKLGRVLGPRGLMPNPKTGTVTEDTATAVKQAMAGRVEYRCDRGGCVQMPVGKMSFSKEAIVENVEFSINAINHAKPASAKGIYLQTLTLSSTMGPGIRLDVKSTVKAKA